MKSILQRQKTKLFLSFLLVITSIMSFGQTVFTENMGTPTATTPIATNVFQNAATLSYSGTADLRATTASSVYPGFSGSGNVFFTNTVGRTFLISGINSAAYSSLVLSFGHYKSIVGANNELTVEVSADGTTFTPLTYTRPTGAGTASWVLITASGSIPATANLRIRFTQASTTSQFRLDDVKLVGTLAATTPTVTTTFPATSITTTSASLSGNVTNIGASAILANGIVYGQTSLTPTPTLLGSNVTDLPSATPGAGVFSSTASSLLVNTQYSFRAYATNTQGISYGSGATFYTLANVPTNPIVSNPSSSTFEVAIGSGDGNPATTLYAIQVDGVSFVQADGTLGATPVWQTASIWGTEIVNGLASETLYAFAVKARNGANVETTFSENVSDFTLANSVATLSLVGASPAFGSLCPNTTSAAQSFSFDGINLNSTDFSIAALSGYSFSTTEFGTYTPTVTITNAATTVSGKVVWVKFNPTAIQSYSGSIAISGGGLPAAFTISVTGSGVNTASTTITGSSSAITAIAAQLSGSYTVGCSPVSTYGFEISATAGYANGSGTPIASTNQVAGAFSGSITGLNANTTYYYKSVATDATGTVYGSQSSFSTTNLSAPVATLASGVTQTEFVANWNSVIGATSYNLDVSASPTFGTTATASNLIISEYGEGSGGNKKYIEIYNGTGATVNLANFEIWKNVNGSNWNFNGSAVATLPLSLTGTLANGATYTIANNVNDVLGANLYSTFLAFNGDDATGLAWNGGSGTTFTLLDAVGVQGIDPGTGWAVAGIANATVDKILIRKPSVLTPNSNWSVTAGTTVANSDWIVSSGVYSTVGQTTNLGSHTMNNVVGSFLPGYENLSVVGTSQVVTGLTANTPYYYRVRASNATSTSNNSNTILVNTVNTSNLTSLVVANCNSTLSSIGTTIYATPKANATGYRFEVTNLNTNSVQVKDKPLQFFRLTELANYNYATTYSVKVMLKVGTEFVGYYGDACLVTTPGLGSPTVSTISVSSPICGSVIPVNATVYTNPLAGATGYRFRVKTASQPEYILDKTLQFFAFNSLPTYVYGATYTVEVAVKTSGDYTPYGPVCTFTTTTPTIAATTCGATVPSTGVVYAVPLAGVTSYVFTVTNLNTPETFAPIVRTNQFFPVSLIPGYAASTPYSISVAVVTGGQQSVTGTACTINPIAEARQTNTTENIDFKAVGYPNPFARNFTLEIVSNTIDNVSIQVYDMLGNRVENRSVLASGAKTIEFGNEYASGVYNVVVSQGETTKSIRMIKR